MEWVIGCDLLYHGTEELFSDLVRTLAFLAKHARGRRTSSTAAARRIPPPCQVVLAWQRRKDVGDYGKFFALAREAGFVLSRPLHTPPRRGSGSGSGWIFQRRNFFAR